MLFQARELKPYADFVKAKDLVVGEVYFRVQFLDDHMLVPERLPRVFVGRNILSDDEGRTPPLLYFRELDSDDVALSEPSEDADEQPLLECEEETEYSGVCGFEAALDQLLECSLRRGKASR